VAELHSQDALQLRARAGGPGFGKLAKVRNNRPDGYFPLLGAPLQALRRPFGGKSSDGGHDCPPGGQFVRGLCLHSRVRGERDGGAGAVQVVCGGEDPDVLGVAGGVCGEAWH